MDAGQEAKMEILADTMQSPLMRSIAKSWQAATLLAAVMYGAPLLAQQGSAMLNLTTIHWFHGLDGSWPGGENISYPARTLVRGSGGALYGTTFGGGEAGYGVVYRLTPPTVPGSAWSETVLHSFTGTDGAGPSGGLTSDAKGNLYGVTSHGGTMGGACSGFFSGCGVVYELTRPATTGSAWTETVLYSFAGTADGASPTGSLSIDKNGNLYGTAQFGGTSDTVCPGTPAGCGVVYELMPPVLSGGAWSYRVLHSFLGAGDGALPNSALVFDNYGALYGTTFFGGISNVGTVFRLEPPNSNAGAWTEHVVYSFTGGNDGAGPSPDLVFGTNRALYGTVRANSTCGGYVFELLPPTAAGSSWTYSVILQTCSLTPPGGGPCCLILNKKTGDLYGTTGDGGAYGYGGVFRLRPPSAPGSSWSATVLQSLAEADPFPSGLLLGDGLLYGTTSGGIKVGYRYLGDGTVFELTP